MTKELEFRVRAVTRFIVTEHDPVAKTTTTIAEVEGGGTANAIAEAFAASANAGAGELRARAVPITDSPPGKAMRCKVVLTGKTANIWPLSGPDVPGRKTEEINSQGRPYTRPDPTDPANFRMDGVNLSFAAVWGGQDPVDGKNACHENRIFADATPSLTFNATVRNQGVTDALETGQEFYVDFIPAPKPEAAS